MAPRWVVTLVAFSGAAAALAAQQAPPTFRAAVDLIAVDVQVVDGDGQPVTRLDREKFEVTIDGKRRRVVSADLVQYASPTDLSPSGARSDGAGRTYILAIDAGSLGPGEALPVIEAARGFLGKVAPDDRVGLFTLPPFGARVDPTGDHSAVRLALGRVAGQRQSLPGQFHLSVPEIIDISSETGGLGPPPTGALASGATRGAPVPIATELGTLQRVQQRECRSTGDLGCLEAIVAEAGALGQYLQERAIQALNGLAALLDLLRQYPGRKTVVVLSAGMAVSDRPGGGIDIGEEARQLGEQAAHANATIYALHIDLGLARAYSAEARRARDTASVNREQRLSSRILDEFSGASAGALLPVLVGNGDIALDRVLRETSAYYLLGVEPANMDRDGRAHRLSVKVNQRGATVRSRQWVVLRSPGREPR